MQNQLSFIFGYMSPNIKSVFDIFAIMFTNFNPQNWFMLSYVRHYIPICGYSWASR